MKAYTAAEMRNIALIGQKHAGKTSLAEALLYTAKAVTRLGKVEDGNTVFDFEPEEHKRVASVHSSVGYLSWQKNKINVIDTPGDPNFFADTKVALSVVEASVVVVDATDAVQAHTARLFAEASHLARGVVINKMGRERADFAATFTALKERLGGNVVAVTLPIGSEANFRGVVDLFDLKAHVYLPGSQDKPTKEDIPADMREAAVAAREVLIEEIAASDEELMEKYLDSGQLAEDEARRGLLAGVASGALCPVFAVDAAANIGIHELLDFIVTSLPPAGSKTGLVARDGDGNDVELRTDGDGMIALVFKTIIDQHAGKMSLLKVVRGCVTKDTVVHNVNKSLDERLGTLLVVQGKKTEPTDMACMGDIVAVAKLKETATGDTLAASKAAPRLSLPPIPPPQIRYRVIPRNVGDEDKLSQALHRMVEEDPALVLGHDDLTKELTLAGFGVSHVDVAIETMARKFHVEVDRATPLVPYRETIAKAVRDVEGKHKKQSGGRGQFGVAMVNVSPLSRGEGYKFVDAIFGGAIPRQFIPAVDKGIQEAMARGVVAGYPVVDVEVELTDGKYHDVDSSEIAFKIAGSKAFQAAAKRGGVVLLEPVMRVDIEVPDATLGDVMGDISGRRGRVLGMDATGGITHVLAQIPMAEMLSYAPDLKSMTQGEGMFTMSHSHYDPVPPHLKDKIIAESPNKPGAADEE